MSLYIHLFQKTLEASVQASPEGTITDSSGKRLNYLFWEGKLKEYPAYNPKEGYAVASKDLVKFFEDMLREIGLNDKEASEFIVYWGPLLQKNDWTYIHFITEECGKIAKLEITPQPQSLMHVYMIFKTLKFKKAFEPQKLKPFERIGFSAIEWGGGAIN